MVIEVNVITGEVKKRPLTQDEIDEYRKRADEERARPRVKTTEERLAAIEALLNL